MLYAFSNFSSLSLPCAWPWGRDVALSYLVIIAAPSSSYDMPFNDECYPLRSDSYCFQRVFVTILKVYEEGMSL